MQTLKINIHLCQITVRRSLYDRWEMVPVSLHGCSCTRWWRSRVPDYHIKMGLYSKCTYFYQQLTTALLESAKWKMAIENISWSSPGELCPWAEIQTCKGWIYCTVNCAMVSRIHVHSYLKPSMYTLNSDFKKKIRISINELLRFPKMRKLKRKKMLLKFKILDKVTNHFFYYSWSSAV